MRKKEGLYIATGVLLFFSIALFFFAQTPLFNGPLNLLTSIVTPIRGSFYIAYLSIVGDDTTEINVLKKENAKLQKALINQEELQKEVKALRDQYESSIIATASLLPAHVVGAPGFIPGVSRIEEIILDHGEKNGVIKGMAVMSDDGLVGTIIQTAPYLSKARIITSSSTSFTAQTQKTHALGIVKGKGDDMIFDNVLLSEKLSVGDSVVTKGDVSERGIGIPPGLLVGSIVSVDKKASELFQQASIVSDIDFARLKTVFIITNL